MRAHGGGAGFPTFALERDGAFILADVGRHFGRPESFAAWLRGAQSQ